MFLFCLKNDCFRYDLEKTFYNLLVQVRIILSYSCKFMKT